tara:strand:- start:827 stop:1012 length:186 start_codon:yes stop_codon:yes gene_type:complete
MKKRQRAEIYQVTLFCDESDCSGECIFTGNIVDEEFEHECVACSEITREIKAYPCTETKVL